MPPRARSTGTSKVTLWVNQLPFAATKAEIAAHFASAAGADGAAALLPSVRVIMKDGKFNGTAFIDMQDWASVDRGLSLHHSTFKTADGSSRKINVREAVQKNQLEQLAKLAEQSVDAPKDGGDDDSGSDDDDGPAEVDHNGEVDPQRKRKRAEEAYLKSRRALSDMAVTCQDCSERFTFAVAEQEFFIAKGWQIPRTRCKPCSVSKNSSKRRRSADHGTALATAAKDSGSKSKGDGEGGGPASGRGKLASDKSAGSHRKNPKSGLCFICGEAGHQAVACPKKYLQQKQEKRAQWEKTKAEAKAKAKAEAEAEAVAESKPQSKNRKKQKRAD